MLDRARKYQFGSWRLDTGDKQLTFAGTPIHLTPRTFDLLAILVEAGGRLVDFDEIFGRVWPNVVVERSNAHQTIAVLRRKLKCFDENELIGMVARRGYRFLGDVCLFDRDIAGPASEDSSGLIPNATSSAVDVSNPKVCSEAREYYSKGFHFFERWSGASARCDIETATALFREAQRIEPTWVAAGSKLAYCYAIQALFFDQDDVLQHRAHLAVQRLLEQDPSNAEAHVVRSEMLWSPMGKFQTVAAAQQLIFANREKPDDSSAELGIICAHQGFADVAMLHLNRAVETDRASLRKRSLLAEGCIWVRELN